MTPFTSVGEAEAGCIVHFWPEAERPSRTGSASGYPGPKDARGRFLFEGEDGTPEPQPEAGEVVLRLTKEEAGQLRALVGITQGEELHRVFTELIGKAPDGWQALHEGCYTNIKISRRR